MRAKIKADQIHWEPLPHFRPKSFQEIVEDMCARFSVQTGLKDMQPGSTLMQIIESVAMESYQMQLAMASLFDWLNMHTHSMPPGPPSAPPLAPPIVEATVRLEQAIDFIPIKITISESTKCNCGAVHVGSDKHSTWCDKYESEL